MAGRSHFVCVPLLLFCLFDGSDNRHLQSYVDDIFGETGVPGVKIIQAKTKTNSIQLCTDIKDELESVKTRLLETTQDNTRLDEEVFGLEREVTKLSLNLSTCTSALSFVTDLYQKQLQIQMNNMLNTIDSEIFHVPNIMILTRELNILKKKIKLAMDSKENSILISILLKEQEDKTNQLNATKLKIDRDPATRTLILQIISLQDQILDLSQEEFTSETTSQLTRRILDLQIQLDGKINELKEQGDSLSHVLELVFVHSKITVLEKRIKFTTEESKSKMTDARRLLRQKIEQLKKAISLLTDHEGNTTLTREILQLQIEVEQLQKLISNTSETVESTLSEQLEIQKKHEVFLQKKLEGADSVVPQLMMKVISIMEEMRKQPQTSPGQHQDILTLLNTCKNDYTTAQTEMKYLRQTCEELPGLQERLEDLKEEHVIKVKENQRYRAMIEALQRHENQTQRECPESEQKITDLQNNLDSKIDELKSKSGAVASLTLEISTLTGNLEELNRQLANSVSKSKVEELQGIIDEKNRELDTKTKELKEQSPQAQRFLQIIAKQTEIERLANMAANDTNYAKIRVLQDQINSLIDGIKVKDDQNTKLIFKILAHQDEIAKLKKQKEDQLEAQAERINDLENDLEHIRSEIKEKSEWIDKSASEILALHKKIKPLEEELSDLKETYDSNLQELQERLNFTQNQLQDNELLLKQSDAKIFELIMNVNELKAQLKNAKKQSSASTQSITDLEERLNIKKKESKKLESTNKDLKQQVEKLRMCCSVNTNCDDIQRQLQQSQEDADHYHQLLQEKEAALKALRHDFDKQAQEKSKLQRDYNSLLEKLNDVENQTIQIAHFTMDPKTAHPRLVLSAGGTEVSTSDIPLQVQDLPGRFDVSLAVLGSTGYSSGRHYWEVSVAGKSCYHIGMASESAPRKGSLSFNPSRGFWTLVLNKQGVLRALNKRPVVIQAETQPLTLGVLLDYKKGQISFYDAGTRSHMYTFSGQTFTNKIYPFINYCVEDGANPTPVVLVQPGSTDWIK